MLISLNTKVDLGTKKAESMLFPIVALLSMSGITQGAIENGVALACKRASKNLKGRKIKHVDGSARYTDIVARWTCDKCFLDTQGRPKPLKFKGKNSLTALIRGTVPGSDPLKVLAVLKRFKTIRPIKGGQYELIKPFFMSATSESLALEPTVNFLTDATTTLSQILTRTKQSRDPDAFWRNVDNPRLSAKAAKQFLAFIRERSLTFLEELDDWLEAHSHREEKSNKKYHRVGLGIFSVYSAPRNGAR